MVEHPPETLEERLDLSVIGARIRFSARPKTFPAQGRQPIVDEPGRLYIQKVKARLLFQLFPFWLRRAFERCASALEIQGAHRLGEKEEEKQHRQLRPDKQTTGPFGSRAWLQSRADAQLMLR